MINARAFVLRTSGSIPKLEPIQIDENLKVGQVLVRILFTSICGTQLEEIFFSSRNQKHMPHLFGHEAMGEVVAVGPGVIFRRPGEKVVIHWRQSSQGVDSEPGKYFSGGGGLSSGKVSTLASFVVVPENRATPLPEGVEPWQGPLLGCSLSTGWGAVRKTGLLRSGELVLIIGLGGVGRASAIASSQTDNVEVIAVDQREMDKSDLIRLGVTAKFSSLEDALLYLKSRHPPESPVLVIDTVGLPTHFERLLEDLANNSRLILVGMPRGGARPALNTQRLLDGFQIAGSNGGDVDPLRDLAEASRCIPDYVSGSGHGKTIVLGWEDFVDGVQLQMSGRVSKVIYRLD